MVLREVLPGEDTGPTRAGACAELCCGTAVLSWKLLEAGRLLCEVLPGEDLCPQGAPVPQELVHVPSCVVGQLSSAGSSWRLAGCCAGFFPVRIYARRVHRFHKSWCMCRVVLWDSCPQLEALRAGKLLCGVLPGEDLCPQGAPVPQGVAHVLSCVVGQLSSAGSSLRLGV